MILLFVYPAKIERNHSNALGNDDVIEILDSGDEVEVENVDVQSHSSSGLVHRKTIQKKVNPTTNHRKNDTNISIGGSTVVQSKSTLTESQMQLNQSDSNHEPIARNLLKKRNSSNGLVAMNEQRNRDESDQAKSTPQNNAQSSLVQPKGNAIKTGSSPESGIFTQKLSSSPNTHQKKPIQYSVGSHGLVAQQKRGLKCHKWINGKWIEIQIDSQGIFHCSYCIRRFKNLHDLSLHMKKSHKNDQYLYDCARCLRQFEQEAGRDRHQCQCDGHHYQCHLCTVYVTTLRSNMKVHMRVHSGVKPFRCTVCKKSFQTNSYLRYHLDFIHSNMNP